MTTTKDTPNQYMGHFYREIEIGNVTVKPEILDTLTKLSQIHYDAGHSGFSSGWGTNAMAYAINIVNTEKHTEGGKFDGNWVNTYNALTANALDKVDDVFTEDGPDKWILGDVKRTMEVMQDTDFSKEDCLTLIDFFRKAVMFEIISPLTGIDSEWNDVGNGILQNNRVSHVFGVRDHTGKINAYDQQAIIFSDNRGITWFTTRESARNIEFPYTGELTYVIVKDDDEREAINEDACELNLVAQYAVGDYLIHANQGSHEIVEINEDTFVTVAKGGVRHTWDKSTLEQVNTLDYSYSGDDKLKTTIKYATWINRPSEEWRKEWEAMIDERNRKEAEARQKLYEDRINTYATQHNLSFEEAERQVNEQDRSKSALILAGAAEAVGVALNTDDEVCTTDEPLTVVEPTTKSSDE